MLYQLGVFFSRSSASLLPIKASAIPYLAILQIVNAIVFFGDGLKPHTPSIWIVFGMVFFEGLIGGAAYVNTFHAVHKSVISCIFSLIQFKLNF